MKTWLLRSLSGLLFLASVALARAAAEEPGVPESPVPEIAPHAGKDKPKAAPVQRTEVANSDADASPVATDPHATKKESAHAADTAGTDCWQDQQSCVRCTGFWVGAEYLLWWVKNGPEPVPLVTNGPLDSEGILGRPGTSVVFGGPSVDYGSISGGRLTLGYWLDSDRNLGIESSGFLLEEKGTGFSQSSDGSAGTSVIARPFFAVNDGTEFRFIVAAPGLSAGNVEVSSSSQLWGTEVNVVKESSSGKNVDAYLFGGFRYMDLAESLDIDTQSAGKVAILAGFIGVPITPPFVVSVNDHFGARNQFYGGQLGGRVNFQRDWVFATLSGKVALGSTHEVVDINGTSNISTPGVSGALPGGLLALPTNSGHHTRNVFVVIPQVGATVGLQLTARLRAFAGYEFLYWSDVVRPGDQIDRGIDRRQVASSPTFDSTATTTRPAFAFRSTEFFAHGLNFGVDFRY